MTRILPASRAKGSVQRWTSRLRHWVLGIGHSLDIGHWSLVIRHFARFLFRRWLLGMAVGMAILAGFLAAAGSGSQPLDEYTFKAELIRQLAKYTTWPRSAFEKHDSPLLLGILGDDPLADKLESYFERISIQGHKVLTKRLKTAGESTGFHMLFIAESEKNSVPQILKPLETNSVLTVSHIEKFIDRKGMVNLVIVRRTETSDKILPEINFASLAKARLEVDPAFASVAVRSIRK